MPDTPNPKPFSRRDFMRRTALATAGTAGATALLAATAEACSKCSEAVEENPPPSPAVLVGAKLHPERVVSMDRTGAPDPNYPEPPTPTEFATRFDYGTVSTLPNGQTLREYVMVSTDHEVEISPGVMFPAWTFNGGVPGPTIRCTEGDQLRFHFYNHTPRDHTIHFHGVHPANMDGAFEIVPPGGYYRYEFEAEPFGCHAYHCHMAPLRKHFGRGMYGAFIVDPPEGRPPAHELVMVLNGFDTAMELEENAFYGVNGPAFAYRDYPIEIPGNELIRIYLVNMTEIDLLNSLHIHGTMFNLYRTGTRLDNYEITDTVMLCQGERSVIELTYKHKGDYLFHAHQNEFTERGWLGIFRVV